MPVLPPPPPSPRPGRFELLCVPRGTNVSCDVCIRVGDSCLFATLVAIFPTACIGDCVPWGGGVGDRALLLRSWLHAPTGSAGVRESAPKNAPLQWGIFGLNESFSMKTRSNPPPHDMSMVFHVRRVPWAFCAHETFMSHEKRTKFVMGGMPSRHSLHARHSRSGW
ncbi:unnamed protein product [Ectocarpus sp. 4 AP-2014]